MKPFHAEIEYRIPRLLDLHYKVLHGTMQKVALESTLEERKDTWNSLVYCRPLDLVTVERSVVDGKVVDTIVGGKDALIFLQSLREERGYIDLETLDYNEEGRGVPVHILVVTREFREWQGRNGNYDWKCPLTLRAEKILATPQETQVAVATVIS